MTEIDMEILQKAKEKAEKQPRLNFWSQSGKTTLLYLKKTVPDFNMSEVMAEALEEYLDNHYNEVHNGIFKNIHKLD
jgi:hypothetical protein